MDKQFLEFWGNLLLQAAKGQAQMENIGKWITQGTGGGQTLEDQFRRAYHLDSKETSATDHPDAFQQAADRFKEAYEDYLSLLDVVPRTRFRELESKNASLQEEVTRLQKEIDRLRGALHGSGEQSQEVIADFQLLLQKQQREFQDLAQQFKTLWREQPAGKKSKTPAKKT